MVTSADATHRRAAGRTLRGGTVLISLGLMIGCEANHFSVATGEQKDVQKFTTIARYYRQKFPTAKFEHRLHFKDGPRGERLHISAPVAVNAEYRHPFASEFLAERSKSADGLTRMIAEDLLFLRNKILFTRESHRRYGGHPYVDCITYVVEIDPTTNLDH